MTVRPAVLERLFQLREAGTTIRTELIAGATTFATLSYITFVQPAVLAGAGMDFGAVIAATCVASRFANSYVRLCHSMASKGCDQLRHLSESTPAKSDLEGVKLQQRVARARVSTCKLLEFNGLSRPLDQRADPKVS
jgi:hypothetical protein